MEQRTTIPERSSLSYGNLAVVVMDLQDGGWQKELVGAQLNKSLVHGNAKRRQVAKLKSLIKRSVDLVNWAKARGVKVCLLEYKGFGPTHAQVAKSCEGALRFEKVKSNVFAVGDLAEQLKELGASTIIMAGTNSTRCMAASEEGACRNGLNVVEPVDTHADVDMGEAGCIFGKNRQLDRELVPNYEGKVYRRDLALWKWLGLIDSANQDETVWLSAVNKFGGAYGKRKRLEKLYLS